MMQRSYKTIQESEFPSTSNSSFDLKQFINSTRLGGTNFQCKLVGLDERQMKETYSIARSDDVFKVFIEDKLAIGAASVPHFNYKTRGGFLVCIDS
jgi:hypothetical protein